MVPLSCLPAYFEAYDAYAQRVDNEVSWVEEEEKRVEELAKTSSGTLLTAAQDEILKAHGCTCSSPSLKLSTTDANVLKKEKAVSQIGSYALAGMHKGHPFYKKTPNTPTSASTTTSGTSSAPAVSSLLLLRSLLPSAPVTQTAEVDGKLPLGLLAGGKPTQRSAWSVRQRFKMRRI